MRRALLMAPLAFMLMLLACPRPRDDGHKPDEPAGGDETEAPASVPVPASEVKAPEAAPDPKPVPADDVEAPASGK